MTKTHIMTTFKMPCLSRYKFDHEGNGFGDKGQLSATLEFGKLKYNLYHDDGTRSWVTVNEIVQYGKHLKELTQINMVRIVGIPMCLTEPQRKEYTGSFFI